MEELGARGDDPLARPGCLLAAQRGVVPPANSSRLAQLESLNARARNARSGDLDGDASAASGFPGDVAAHRQDAVTDLGGRVLLGAADVTRDDLGALTGEDLDRRLPHS